MSRHTKDRTQDQVAASQAKAVSFLKNVVGDASKAAEIESLSVAKYGQRKGFVITNPARRRFGIMSSGTYSSMSKLELISELDAADARIGELEDFLEGAADLLADDDDEEFSGDEEE
jgi:hypothetical protein